MLSRRYFIKNIGLGVSSSVFLPNRTFASSVSESYGKTDVCVVHPVDHGRALINPGMGWTMHYYSNSLDYYGSRLEPSDTLDDFPGLSTVYLRLPWAYIEPEEGVFNWQVLDTPAQRWIEKGKKVALRITACESNIRFATPEWVQKAGAKGFNFGKDKNLWEPDYGDPVFLEKVDHFVRAMADRYDGNPNIAFIDLGHFGIWGEGHTFWSTKKEYSLEIKKKHLDIYSNQFKKTLLCVSDDYAGANESKDLSFSAYALSKGVTLRDDSIMVDKPPHSWYSAELAQDFWPSLPVILEHQHYGLSLESGAWNKDIFAQSVEVYHASYMSIHWWPRIFLKENMDIIQQINLRMGYRIQLRELSYPNVVTIGQPFSVTSVWCNSGVAPCYLGGYPCITIKDMKGGIVSVLVDNNFNVKNLKTSSSNHFLYEELTSPFFIGSKLNDPLANYGYKIERGKYHLFVSIGELDGTPTIELPYDNDGNKRCKMGEIIIH